MADTAITNTGTLGLVDQLIKDGVAREQEVSDQVNGSTVSSASDALKLQLVFIKYSTQITASSQMVKTIGEAMSATVRNIS